MSHSLCSLHSRHMSQPDCCIRASVTAGLLHHMPQLCHNAVFACGVSHKTANRQAQGQFFAERKQNKSLSSPGRLEPRIAKRSFACLAVGSRALVEKIFHFQSDPNTRPCAISEVNISQIYTQRFVCMHLSIPSRGTKTLCAECMPLFP